MNSALGSTRARRRSYAPRNMPLWIGLVLVGALIVCAVAAPVLAPFAPNEARFVFVDGRFVQPPYAPGTHGMWLGSDVVGRDMLSRLIYGTRHVLLFCGVAALLRVALGALIGILAGWYHRAARVADILAGVSSALPELFFAVLCVTVAVPLVIAATASDLLNLPLDPFARTLLIFVITLSVTGWAETTVRCRVAVQALQGAPFIEAAHALGLRRGAVLWRHVLPNVRDMLLIETAYAMAGVLLLVAELAYLGFFVGGSEQAIISDRLVPVSSEWGGLLAEGARNPRYAWLLLEPIGAFTVAIIAFNLVAEGLRRRR